jgi:hypothetical protein
VSESGGLNDQPRIGVGRILRDVTHFLLPQRDATFATERALPDAVSSLRFATLSSPLGFHGYEGPDWVGGRVDATRVQLHVNPPRYGDAFTPVFTGRFVARDGKVVLEGRFQLPAVTQAFMAALYLFAAFLFAYSIASGSLLAIVDDDAVAFLLPLFLLVLTALGAVFVQIGWRGSSVALMSAVIRNALVARRAA